MAKQVFLIPKIDIHHRNMRKNVLHRLVPFLLTLEFLDFFSPGNISFHYDIITSYVRNQH